MIILFSPAKTFKPTNEKATSVPVFENQAHHLVSQIQKMPTNKIQKTMRLSDKLLSQVMTYYQTFNKEKTPAIYTYMGQAYKALDIYHFTKSHLKTINERVYILSALYGILKPLDGISCYRLDFKNHPFTSLESYWRKDINQYLSQMHPNETMINLASAEFSKLIDPNQKMITLDFLIKDQVSYKQISMHLKTMRGLFLRHLILYDIKTIEEIKKIVIDHYHFDPIQSDEKKLVFVKVLKP